MSPTSSGFDYRIADRDGWAAWLREVSGSDAPEVEVVHRTLRIRDDGPPSRTVAPPATDTTERAAEAAAASGVEAAGAAAGAAEAGSGGVAAAPPSAVAAAPSDGVVARVLAGGG